MANRQVPFFNYPALAARYESEYVAIFTDVIRRGAYILQRDLSEFEKSAAEFLGVKHCIGVADGTNAIILCLIASGIGFGDEVILPSHTYVATAAAVHFVGASPVLVECGSDHLIDVDDIERVITARTRAIMPVHLNGRICEMDRITALASLRKLEIIEDGAQCFGAKYLGKSAGTFGRAASISFYPAKVIGCFGDGGAVLTNDDGYAEKILELRDHGRGVSGEVMRWGTNSRLDNLQAAILNFKLKHYPGEISRRREIAQLYQSMLGENDQLRLPPDPTSDAKRFDIYQNYEIEAEYRDELRLFLKERGIGTLVQWGGKAVHQIEALKLNFSLPRTEALFAKCMMLPMHTALSDADVDYVASSVREFYESR